MKKKRYLLILFACFYYSCDPAPAIFNFETKNFGPNAVISVKSSENGETLKVENITNGNQTFRINMPKKGYAILSTYDDGHDEEYSFYWIRGIIRGFLTEKTPRLTRLKSYRLKKVKK